MKKLGLLLCALAMFGATPALAAPQGSASAARGASGRGLDGQLTVLGILGYSYYYANAYGVGVRYQKILVPDLLRAKIHDDLSIEGGLDVVHSSWDYWWPGWFGVSGSYTGISPVVGLNWNFWLTDQIALYPKIDLGYEFGSVKWTSNDPNWAYYSPYFHAHNYGGAYLDLAGGIAIKLDRVSLRGQMGIHGLYLGIGFAL